MEHSPTLNVEAALPSCFIQPCFENFLRFRSQVWSITLLLPSGSFPLWVQRYELILKRANFSGIFFSAPSIMCEERQRLASLWDNHTFKADGLNWMSFELSWNRNTANNHIKDKIDLKIIKILFFPIANTWKVATPSTPILVKQLIYNDISGAVCPVFATPMLPLCYPSKFLPLSFAYSRTIVWV